MSETRLEQQISRLTDSVNTLAGDIRQLNNEIDALKRMMAKVLEYELAAMTPEHRKATKDQVSISRFQTYQAGLKVDIPSIPAGPDRFA